MQARGNTLLKFSEAHDRRDSPADDGAPPWQILVVDDDEQVHLVTRYVFRGVRILGRELEFVSAMSAAEARDLLRSQRRRYACILLDVVMESDDAGLGLVQFIRDDLADKALRIILRTGQPGLVPEREVIARYDINDYRSKAELTSEHLVTSLTAALRAFQQIRTVEEGRLRAERILHAASQLDTTQTLEYYASNVVTTLCGLLSLPDEGCVLACDKQSDGDTYRMLACNGGVAPEVFSSPDVTAALRAMEEIVSGTWLALYMQGGKGCLYVALCPRPRHLGELDRTMLNLYSAHVAVGFESARVFEALATVAYTDALTGLPNRVGFERDVAERISGGDRLALVIADIDGFQAVNDGLGHLVGDRTIQTTADMLRDLFGEGAVIARVSGDSFGILLNGAQCDRLIDCLGRLQLRTRFPLRVGDHDIPLGVSIGIACYPEHGQTAQALFQNAGIALKQAKRVNRGGYEYFDSAQETYLQQRLNVMRDLRHAIECGGFRLLFQPQIKLTAGKVFGVEALVRWERESGQLLAAMEFIPAAEHSGQIVAIGAWVLAEACRQQVAWLRQDGLNLQVAVNVSMRQLKDPDFIPLLRRVIAQSGIDPAKLEIEITESMMIENAEILIDLMEKVRALGVLVAMDDFGTGYSSLSSLQNLPLDRLKIDRSFITRLTQTKEDQVIAAMVINMGHLLGLEVTAEGVEQLEQASLLAKMGCDDVQGYFYGKPMLADNLKNFALEGIWRA